MTTRTNGGSALIKSLEHEGVEVIFGLPGGAILPVYDPIIDSPVRIHAINERSAAIRVRPKAMLVRSEASWLDEGGACPEVGVLVTAE